MGETFSQIAPRGIPSDDCPGSDVARHDGSGADQRASLDPDASKDHRAGPERGATLDDRGEQLPVVFGLKPTLVAGRAGVVVVDEEHAVANEDLVVDLYAAADERMTLDLAVRADYGATLDLDERT